MLSRTWYLLFYQIPPKPLYLRAKIRQRLVKLGAVPVKNSAYALPARPDLLEPLRAIAAETEEGGGEAYICEARFVDEKTEDELTDRFVRERSADWRALLGEIRNAAAGGDAVRRFRARVAELGAIDYFGGAAGREAAAALDELETHTARASRKLGAHRRPPVPGATWVTRAGVGVDRMATAWLVRRFVDKHARFRFADAGEEAKASEVGFDMPGGTFGHERGRCTYEVVAEAVKLRTRAVRRIGRIVRDIDLKATKAKYPETAGVEQMIAGIIRGTPSDDGRLERAFALFDDLHKAFSSS